MKRKKINKIILKIFIVMALVVFGIPYIISMFMPDYIEPENQQAYSDKFEKSANIVINNKDSLHVVNNIDSLDVFINTYDTIGYSNSQKKQFIFVSKKLQNKQRWKDNLMVERRINNATYIDGSNLHLVEAVKNSLNDPESFEHVKTNFYTNKDMEWIAIDMKFRAKNKFNAIITSTATCQLTFEDKVNYLKIK